MKRLAALLFVAAIAGCYSKSTAPQTAGTAPTISQLSPSSATANGPAFNLEVDGTNFATQAVVAFNATAEPTTFVNSGRLIAAIPASAIAVSGTASVTVTNPGTPGGPYGGGTSAVTSSPKSFTVN